MYRIPFKLILILLAIWFLLPEIVQACPSCYGTTKTTMTHATNLAVLSLLGVTGSILGGFGTFFIYIIKRAKALNSPSDHEKGDLQ